MCTKLLFHAGYMLSEQKKPFKLDGKKSKCQELLITQRLWYGKTTHFELTTNTNIQMLIKQHCGTLKLNAEYLHLYANPNST